MGECHAHKSCCILPLERCQEDLHNTLYRQLSEQTTWQNGDFDLYVNKYIYKHLIYLLFNVNLKKKVGDDYPDFLAGFPFHPHPPQVCNLKLLFIFLRIKFRNVLGMCGNLWCVCGAFAVLPRVN